jgi:phytoene desaturase
MKNSFLRKCLSFHPLLIGGSPLNTPSLYTMIMQFEKEWGVYYAQGGTGAIVDGLVKLFEELGGRLILNTEVEEITIENNRVKGVILNGQQVLTDYVICNSDLAQSYTSLISPQHRKKSSNKKYERMHYSSSLFVTYFGTKKRYLDSKLHHHNILFNNRYKGLLHDIFKPKTLPEDFALYLHMPTITDPSIAPPGHESFYVLSLVPNLNAEIPWETLAETYRDKILDYLEKNYLPDLKENIVALHHIDPLHFKQTLNSYNGAAFAFQPRLTQSAYFRPHNQSNEFKGLYFVGAGTHPGAGAPAVLSSGKITADLISSNLRVA